MQIIAVFLQVNGSFLQSWPAILSCKLLQFFCKSMAVSCNSDLQFFLANYFSCSASRWQLFFNPEVQFFLANDCSFSASWLQLFCNPELQLEETLVSSWLMLRNFYLWWPETQGAYSGTLAIGITQPPSVDQLGEPEFKLATLGDTCKHWYANYFLCANRLTGDPCF